jgi:dUTP pyrophosphatase
MASEYTPYKLYIEVDDIDAEFFEHYSKKIRNHNDDIATNSHADSGFDLYLPNNTRFQTHEVNKVNFLVRCAMVRVHDDLREQPCAFYMYPRSSISKTNVRLANNVGIIDSGYRGHLCGMFDTVYCHSQYIEYEKFTRLVQVCSPTLEPFKIELVRDIMQLGMTERGEGGFGSTGTS